jgi:hypothetical protein
MKTGTRIALAFLLVLGLALASTGCASPGSRDDWTGKLTDLSKSYLFKGYQFNLYRYGSEVGSDADSLGKSYVNMSFYVLPEYTSTNGYDPSAGYNVKKLSIANVHVSATSKKGTVGDLAVFKPGTLDPTGPRVDIVGTVKRADFDISPADATGRQSILYLELDRIALYDLDESPAAANGANPTIDQIYAELGIDQAAVALTLAFRIELTTVSGKVLFHEVEIVLPPANVDVAASEFHYEYFEADVVDMEPFLEK